MKTTKRITNLLTVAVVATAVLIGSTASALAGTTTVLDDTATWNYFHPLDGTDPAVADTDFDTTWYTQNDTGNSYNGPAFAGSGSGMFGYGSISYGAITANIGAPPSGSRYTAYFVTTFDLGSVSASSVTDLTAKLLADDGAFVYINGQFAGDINAGASDSYTAMSSGSGSEAVTSTITLDRSLLVDGINSIALSLHNTSATSSDLGFTMITLLAGVHSSAATIKKGPYLIYPNNPAKMTVMLQADATAATCSVRWGTSASYSDGTANLTAFGSDKQYRTTITGLTADTRYYYEVNLDGALHNGTFRTAPSASGTSTVIYAVGDTRSSPAGLNNILSAMLADVDSASSIRETLWMHVGDWVNSGDNEDDWTNQFFNRDYAGSLEIQRRLPIMGCRGSHEATGAVYNKYYPYTELVESSVTPAPASSVHYYSFDYGPVHFAVIDDNISRDVGSTQYNWLVADLTESTRKWTILMFHEPAYSAGGHADNLINRTLVSNLQSAGFSIHMTLVGHNHYYARCEANGIVHLTTGGGGAPLYAPDLNFSDYVVAAERQLTFARLDINTDTLDCTVKNSSGTVVDSFSITSSPAVTLDGRFAEGSVASNALPGALVGNLSMANATGEFTYTLESGGDNDNFSIASDSTNLRTAVWMNAASYNISIVATETGGDNLVVTNDFTINATVPTHLLLKVTATMDASPTASSQVGSLGARPGSGTIFEIVGGRKELFEIDASGTNLMQVVGSDPGSEGDVHYLEIKASNAGVTSDAYYLIEATVDTTSGTPNTLLIIR